VSRETIALGGPAGSGKTHSCLTIAKELPDSKFVFIECDRPNILGMLQYQFTGLKNVSVIPAYSWGDFRNAVDNIKQQVVSKALGPNDWVIVDGVDLVIQYTKYEFFSRVYSSDGSGANTWDAMIDKRRGKGDKGGGPLLEPSDWDAIYSQYESYMGYLAFIMPCHFIATCGVEPLNLKSMYESDEVKSFYSSMGVYVKFEGYKRNPRMFNTLILLTADTGGYYYTIWRDTYSARIKDYEKIRNLKQSNRSFFLSFLAQKAGWGTEG